MSKVFITAPSRQNDATFPIFHLRISEDTEIKLCTAYTVRELEAIGAVVEELLNGLATARIQERRREEL
jgi:hypothetical protein